MDHGSRRAESNQLLLELAARFAERWDYGIVEAAHMELAEPSIATAFDRCVERGAELVIVAPYFLLPGRHWYQDIPRLTAEAAARHPQVRFLVAAPLGLHPLVLQVMQDRIDHCLSHIRDGGPGCEACGEGQRCRLGGGPADEETL